MQRLKVILSMQDERIDILNALSKDLPLDSSVNFSALADATEGFTGADLKAVLYNAQLEAVHKALHDARPLHSSMDSVDDFTPPEYVGSGSVISSPNTMRKVSGN